MPLVLLCASVAPSSAETKLAMVAGTQKVGPVTGLRLPRYVSLRSDKVNMRRGPARQHATLWVYKKAGLPVEITAEFENWRKIRDADGTEGWVYHSLLSGRRTAMVTPWAKKDVLHPVFEKPERKAQLVARVGPRVIANVTRCEKSWCQVEGKGFAGYIQQEKLWGVYPTDTF